MTNRSMRFFEGDKLRGGWGIILAVMAGCMLAGSVAYGHDGGETNPPPSEPYCIENDPCTGECTKQSKGNPVRLFSGESTENKQFLRLGGPLNMRVRITYGSRRDYHSQVGHNWSMSYIWRLYEVADTNAPFVVRNGDSERISYEPRGDGSYISRDTRHEILTIDTNGNYVVAHKDHSVYVFDTDGKLTSISDGKGAELRLTYNGEGKQPIIGRSLYSNLSTNMVVARDYQLSHIDEYIGTNATGRGYSIAYDGTGHITNITDQASRNVSLTYSSGGELLEMQDPEGNAYTCTYDELGRLKTFVGLGCSDCVLVEDFYNADGYVTNQVQGVGAQGREMIVDYLSPERTVATFLVKGPDSGVLHIRSETQDFTIDGFGSTKLRKETIDYGFGVTNLTEYWYDGFGAVTQRLDNGIARMETTYDSRYNEVLSRREVSAGVYLVQTNTFDADNNLTEEKIWLTDQPTNIFITRYEYDAQNRMTKEKHMLADATELVTELVYDPNGQVERKIDPRGNAMAYEYDSFGFMAREYDPTNTAYQTQYQYDSVGNLTNRIDVLGRETHFEYDKLGRKTREVNALGYEDRWIYNGPLLIEEEIGRNGATPGRVTQYGYDGLNRRISIDRLDDANATQRWMSVVYDSDGNVLFETNALGFGTAYTYDNKGHLTTKLDPYGALTTYGYDAWGHVTSIIDAVGVETRMSYDYLGRLTNQVDALGTDVERSTGYRYNALGDRIEIIQPDGSSTHFAYDAVGRLLGVGGSRLYPTAYTYDANGNQVTATDARGKTITNVYDTYNRRSEVIYSDGLKSLYSYDSVGNLISATDGNTNTTWFTYDNLNRQISLSKPNDSNTLLQVTSYNPWSQVVGTSNIAGGVTSTLYDRFGRPTNKLDAAGLALSCEYDVLGQLMVTRWPNGSSISNIYTNTRLTAVWSRSSNVTTFGYDSQGHRIATVDSLGATNTISFDALGRMRFQTNALGEATSYIYDNFGQVISVTYANGKSEIRQYDARGKVTNHYGAGQYPISYRYDAAGNLTNMVDGNGSATSWSYDGRNRPVRKTYDDGSYYDYAYDGNGNLASRRDAKGETTLYAYNAQNLPTLIDHSDDADVSFTYDELGRRMSMVDGQGTSTWAYDLAGRIVTNTQGVLGGTVIYTYDTEGNRTSMEVNGIPTGYGYDDAGRLASVSNVVGVFTYAWHPYADLVQAVTYPSGASTTNAYDILRRLSYKGNLNSTGTVVSGLAYSYDPVGLRTNQAHADGSGRAYGYDDTYQLVEADGYLVGGGADTNYAYEYGYDSIGNYTQVVDRGVAEVYRPNSLNQYTNTTTRPVLAYDLNGNLLDDSAQTYGWDQENRLVSATNAAGHVEFAYDGLGWKVEQREYANGILSKTTRYLYDGVLPVAELDGSNNIVRTITRGLDLSQTMAGAGGIGGLLALTTHEASGTNSYFYFYDGNGNVVDLIGEDDAVAAHYEYGPFGNRRSASGPLADQPYRFSSKEAIDPAGLYYYGYRHYSPSIGRWLNPDPLGEYQFRDSIQNGKSFSERVSIMVHSRRPLYIFINNNGISSVDYLGLAQVCCRQLHPAFGVIPIPSSIARHCYLQFDAGGGTSSTCGLNVPSKCKTCIGPDQGPPPGASPTVCHNIGPVDFCLANACSKSQRGQDCDDFNNDGNPYDKTGNNSNHWVNRRLNDCNVKFQLNWNGDPIIPPGPPYSGGPNNQPPII